MKGMRPFNSPMLAQMSIIMATYSPTQKGIVMKSTTKMKSSD